MRLWRVSLANGIRVPSFHWRPATNGSHPKCELFGGPYPSILLTRSQCLMFLRIPPEYPILPGESGGLCWGMHCLGRITRPKQQASRELRINSLIQTQMAKPGHSPRSKRLWTYLLWTFLIQQSLQRARIGVWDWREIQQPRNADEYFFRIQDLRDGV